MRQLGRYLIRNWPLFVWLAVGVVLFWPVRGYYVALPSPDSAPFFPAGHRLRLLEQILAGTTVVTPHHLLSLIFPPLPLNDFFYLLDTMLVAVGCAWFLRGRDVPPLAAWIGGGILAFAGYSFTLVSAGHMGFFHMTAYAVFMFGALVRAVRWGRWPYYILTAIFAAWTIVFAPDFGPIMLLLAAAYGLWILLSNADGTPWVRQWRFLAIGLPIAALCFALGSWKTIRNILNEHVSHREGQIAATAPTQEAKEGESDDPHTRWIFATNWSLHPEELIEFVVPNLYGTQSGDPKAPYWGKLGRTLDWEKHHQGFPNFRQHTIYLGALQLMLAALAVGAWWRGRRRVVGDQERGEELADSVATPFWQSDIPFWTAVWVIGLLLALGRHAPLYRLFYSLPYMSLLRAPVKFIRFVEIATAILAASGVAALFNGEIKRRWGWVVAAAIGAFALIVSALWANSDTTVIQRALEPLRMASIAGLLKQNLVHALLHGAVAFAVSGAVFWLGGQQKHRTLYLTAAITLWLAIDVTLVNRRFIQAWDLSAHYKPNDIVKKILEDGCPAPVVANYVTPNQNQDWLSASFNMNGIVNSTPSPQSQTPFAKLHAALENDPIRYWELCGAKYAVLPNQAGRALAGQRLKPISTFELGNGQVWATQDLGQAILIAEIPNAMPYAWLTPTWSVVPDKQSLNKTVKNSNRNHTVVIGEKQGFFGYPKSTAGTVAVKQVRYEKGKRSTILEVDSPAEQFLVLRSRNDRKPKLSYAKLNGKKCNLKTANHVWVGLVVPAGSHYVELGATSSTTSGFAILAQFLILVVSVGKLVFMSRHSV